MTNEGVKCRLHQAGDFQKIFAVGGRTGLSGGGLIPFHDRIPSRSCSSIVPEYRLAQTQPGRKSEKRHRAVIVSTSRPVLWSLLVVPAAAIQYFSGTVRQIYDSTPRVCQSTSTLSAVRRSVMTSSRARKYQSELPPPTRVSISVVSFNTLTFALSDTADGPTPARRFDMRSA